MPYLPPNQQRHHSQLGPLRVGVSVGDQIVTRCKFQRRPNRNIVVSLYSRCRVQNTRSFRARDARLNRAPAAGPCLVDTRCCRPLRPPTQRSRRRAAARLTGVSRCSAHHRGTADVMSGHLPFPSLPSGIQGHSPWSGGQGGKAP